MSKRNNKIFDYTKTERFAVVRKMVKNRRYYCNFKTLYETKEAAIAEAVRLGNELEPAGNFYVVEIQHITNWK